MILQKIERVKNRVFRMLLFAMMGGIIGSGCHQNSVNEPIGNNYEIPVATDKINEPESKDLPDTHNDMLISEVEESTTTIPKQPQTEPTIIMNDYQAFFQDYEGCIVILDASHNQLTVYNNELTQQEASPCSTFKIISGLIGLEEGVLSSGDSTMSYTGLKYPIDAWNMELTFKEAFQCSCVWYFKQVLEQVGNNKVEQYIHQLNYGNEDISTWDGSGMNPTEDTNGFWLESSLKITPVQQVNLLSNIFDKYAIFSKHNIEIMKDILYVDSNQSYSLYGKTGTGNHQAWYVGFFEQDQERYYFATRLVAQDSQNVTGNKAKEITINIFEQESFSVDEEANQMTNHEAENPSFREYEYIDDSVQTKDNPQSDLSIQWVDDDLVDPSQVKEVIVEHSEESTKVLITPHTLLKDFNLLKLELLACDDAGNMTFKTDKLYGMDMLEAEQPIVVSLTFVGDMPEYGFSFTDEEGELRQFYLEISGMDGSLILVEF